MGFWKKLKLDLFWIFLPHLVIKRLEQHLDLLYRGLEGKEALIRELEEQVFKLCEFIWERLGEKALQEALERIRNKETSGEPEISRKILEEIEEILNEH